MMYHAIIIKNKTLDGARSTDGATALDGAYAVVRPAIDGITDIEWYHGCRLFGEPMNSEVELRNMVKMSYCLVNLDGWNDIINSLDDPHVINNTSLSSWDSFISTNVRPDKWDPQREIY